MNDTNTNTDTLAKDFYVATFVVSLMLNLIVATTWMTLKFSGLI